MPFRKVLFWIHLVAGIISGLSIGIMCFTGTVLAFEKELVAWAERDARRVAPPGPDAPRLSLDQLQARLRETEPEARPVSIVIQNDPGAAVAFSTGRSGGFHLDPYTGDVRQPQSTAMATFMHTMVDWHRYLGFHGETSRPRGKWINGVCNVAFCVLALTGLYLWMPRTWSWRGVKAIALFNGGLRGKARDFNWHNVIGLWSAPILIVLTLTAMPISFRWAGNAIYSLTGTPPPAPGAAAGPAATPPVDVPKPPDGARPLGYDALLAAVQTEIPAWRTITLRLAGGPGRGGGGARPASAEAGRDARPAGAEPRRSEATGRTRPEASGPSPATFVVREAGSWPRTATTTLSLDPFTGAILRRSGFAELNAAQQVRSWTRFLHTGEAVGSIGQLLAGLACLGGVFLVYTGFALAWRRFFGRREQTPPATRDQRHAAPATSSAAR